MANHTSRGFGQKICLKWLLLLLVVALLAGCSQTPSQTPSAEEGTSSGEQTSSRPITLAYTATDSLNPYLAKTKTNQELAGLLYDGLMVLDSSMTANLRLANSIENKGTTVTVTLKEAYFSDGTLVTPEDVIGSYEAALEGEYLSYKDDFQNVKEVSKTQSGAIEFHLSYEDPYFVNFLDFPVYKQGSEDQQNKDNKDLPPIGCGRYVFHEESGSYWLSANPKWWGGQIATERINLLNLPDDDAIHHGVQVGTVQWYYSDLQTGTLPGGLTTVSKQVPLQNLVYVGCNMNSGAVSRREVRLAISYAISRQTVAETAYFGAAVPAKGMYPSGLEVVSGLQTLEAQSNKQTALSWLEKAGYTKTDKDGYRKKGDQTFSVRIIYNEENDARASMASLLATQLKDIGCKVKLEPLSFAGYQNSIKHGYYDLYIGEMRIPDNLDLYPFITAGGLLSPDVSEQPVSGDSSDPLIGGEGADAGILGTQDVSDDPATAARAAYRYHTGKGSLTEMVSCLNEQLPVIPVCHRTGMLLYANSISGNPAPLADDPFNGIESCTIESKE